MVSKTHLDLGFTDYAKNVYDKYLNEYIPGAISLANEMNTESNKNLFGQQARGLLKRRLKIQLPKIKKNLLMHLSAATSFLTLCRLQLTPSFWMKI